MSGNDTFEIIKKRRSHNMTGDYEKKKIENLLIYRQKQLLMNLYQITLFPTQQKKSNAVSIHEKFEKIERLQKN